MISFFSCMSHNSGYVPIDFVFFHFSATVERTLHEGKVQNPNKEL